MRFLKKVNHLQINILTYIQERVWNWQSLNTVNFYVYKDLDYSFYTQKRDVFIAKTVSLGRSCSLLEIYKKYIRYSNQNVYFLKFTYRSNVSKIRHSFSIVTLVKKKTIITTVKKNASLTLKITAKCPIQSYSVFRTWRRIRHLLCLLSILTCKWDGPPRRRYVSLSRELHSLKAGDAHPLRHRRLHVELPLLVVGVRKRAPTVHVKKHPGLWGKKPLQVKQGSV